MVDGLFEVVHALLHLFGMLAQPVLGALQFLGVRAKLGLFGSLAIRLPGLFSPLGSDGLPIILREGRNGQGHEET